LDTQRFALLVFTFVFNKTAYAVKRFLNCRFFITATTAIEVLELVVHSQAKDALIHLADNRVTVLKVGTPVLVELIFKTGTQVKAHMIAFQLIKLGHRVIQSSQWVNIELVVLEIDQIVGVDVHIPPCGVVVLKEVVEAHLTAQVINDAILETGTKAKALNFTAVNQVNAHSGLTLIGLSLCSTHAEHEHTNHRKNLFHFR